MTRPTCEFCGDPMPEGQEMFKCHGYCEPCPKPLLPKPKVPASFGCDHDAEEIHDPRKPFGFDAWSCKKCGTKFYIPKYEAV